MNSIERAKYVSSLREKYPVGTRIMIDFMSNEPRPIAPGTCGTVKKVDDMGIIHCIFDDGRFLGILVGVDHFHVI